MLGCLHRFPVSCLDRVCGKNNAPEKRNSPVIYGPVKAIKKAKLGGGFKHFLFTPLLGEDSQFDCKHMIGCFRSQALHARGCSAVPSVFE